MRISISIFQSPRTVGLLILSLAGCTMPPAEPIHPEQLASTVTSRALDTEAIDRALEQIPASSWFEPEALLRSTDERAPWIRYALAFNPKVREARRRVAILQAAAGVAASADSAMIAGELMRMPNETFSLELDMTLDILSLFHYGRSEARETLLHAEVREAVGELHEAVWDAVIAIHTEWDQLAIDQSLVTDLNGLLAEAKSDTERIRLLGERGWLPNLQQVAAQAAHATVELELSMILVEISERRGRLCALAGLSQWPIERDSVPSPRVPTHPMPRSDPPDGATLISDHPRLKRLHLDYAVAEARLVEAAVMAWPMLRLGPSIDVVDSMLAGGAMVDLEVPDRARAESQIAVAKEQRLLARERLENALADLLREEIVARELLLETANAVGVVSGTLDANTAESWRAGRALFRTDAATLERWTMELERRSMALRRIAEQRRAHATAYWELRSARGPQDLEAPKLARRVP